MNIFGRAAGFARPRWGAKILFSLLGLTLLFAMGPQYLSASQDAQAPPQGAPPPAEQAPPYTQSTPEQLQELVAPIALYPDSLVAQILAASTFPDQIVEADRWMQDNSGLQGDALGHAVDQQPWDPSVKALTGFPSVLGNMDKNLSWTSSLGDAYYNQQQDVMDAIQVMRQRAEAAGNLKTTPQQNVTTQDSTIVVQPADPQVVYVPAYDPWMAYGGPISPWPGWYQYPGIWYGGPYLSFGAGFGIGFFGGFGWGWNHWGFDWHHRYATFGGGRYYSRSTTFYNRNSINRGGGAAFNRGNINRGGGARNGVSNRPGATARAFNGNKQAVRGYAAPRGQNGTRSGAFSGIEKGGQTKSYSARGQASVNRGASRGGGGAARSGGGGGSRGGGGGHH
ncbi:MAG: DUF3300 domain-containing protein [Terriglobia bacterium]